MSCYFHTHAQSVKAIDGYMDRRTSAEQSNWGLRERAPHFGTRSRSPPIIQYSTLAPNNPFYRITLTLLTNLFMMLKNGGGAKLVRSISQVQCV